MVKSIFLGKIEKLDLTKVILGASLSVFGIILCCIIIRGGTEEREELEEARSYFMCEWLRVPVVLSSFVHFLHILFGGNEIFCIFAIGRGRCHYLSQTNGC